MNEFKNFHPIVNFAYFTLAIVFSCIFMHPTALAISLCTSLAYSAALRGASQLKKSLAFAVPVLLLAAIVNPAFNHAGVTILAYLPSGNPLTLESICYGLLSGTMLASVILLFGCLAEVITSDKFIYLFGRVAPALSLTLSMTMRFIPMLADQFKKVAAAHKCVGASAAKGVVGKMKNAVSILSVMVTLSLENSVDTADSMRARGYGLSGRTAFSIYTFSKRDAVSLGAIIIFAAYVIIGASFGALRFGCFPAVSTAPFSAYVLSVYAAYFLLFTLPLIIEFSEVIKWKYIKSKI